MPKHTRVLRISASCFTLFVLLAIDSSISEIYNVDDTNGYGRRFDGIGALSAGASSKLLVNYPDQQRNEILDFLFKPNYGASLHILKVEIGGDGQSTDGTEASHMHESWEENYQRGYEWWLMTEAKKRNPDILLYGLPWSFPYWIGNGTFNAYANPEVTADYVYRWINGAKVHYNLTIDIIGIWNERNYSTTYIKTLRQTLDQHGLQDVKICAADDFSWQFADAVLADPELAEVVDFLGTHYPNTISTLEALSTGKPLWASEDHVGSVACRCAMLNRNYVTGLMTSTISWSPIASFYYGLPDFPAGIMEAAEPWSGNYDVNEQIWVTAHTTQFTKPGWTYLAHGFGVGNLAHGGSYVSLFDRNTGALTIVIETAVCTGPIISQVKGHNWYTQSLPSQRNVFPQTATFKLTGSFADISVLNVWRTKFASGQNSSTSFTAKAPVQVVNMMVTITLGVNEMYTLTTLTTGQKGTAPEPPHSKPFPLPYKDDFEDYAPSAEPYNMAQQVGAWEVAEVGPPHGQVARQMVLHHPVYWCWGRAYPANTTINVIGNYLWRDIYVHVDARVGSVNGTNAVYVGARIDRGGCLVNPALGVFFFIYPKTSRYELTNDLARQKILSQGSVEITGDWMTLGLLLEGNMAYAFFNGHSLINCTIPRSPTNGFAGLGTDPYGLADFDNLELQTAEDAWDRMRIQSGKSDTLLFKRLSKSVDISP